MPVTALLATLNNILAAGPYCPHAPDLDQPASCRPLGKGPGVSSFNKVSEQHLPIERKLVCKGMQRVSADSEGSTGGNLNGDGQGTVTIRRQGRQRLSGKVDPGVKCVGRGQLAPGQGIAWVGSKNTEGEAASSAPVLGIGLSKEQRYASVQNCSVLNCPITTQSDVKDMVDKCMLENEAVD